MTRPAIVGPFVKSAYSGQQDNCVETAPLANGGKAIRDSKDQGGTMLFFDADKWTAFVAGVQTEAFNAR